MVFSHFCYIYALRNQCLKIYNSFLAFYSTVNLRYNRMLLGSSTHMCSLHFLTVLDTISLWRFFLNSTVLSTISETFKLFICKAQDTRLPTLIASSPFSAMENSQSGFHLSSGFFAQNISTLFLSLQYIGCPFSADIMYQIYPVPVVFSRWQCKELCQRLFCALEQDGRCISVVFWTWHRLELRSHPADHFHHHPEKKHNSACQLLYFLVDNLYLVPGLHMACLLVYCTWCSTAVSAGVQLVCCP